MNSVFNFQRFKDSKKLYCLTCCNDKKLSLIENCAYVRVHACVCYVCELFKKLMLCVYCIWKCSLNCLFGHRSLIFFRLKESAQNKDGTKLSEIKTASLHYLISSPCLA